MKLYTELIAMHPDVPMPDEQTFCPSFWQADDFDSDGDFYADSLAGRWTTLRLEKRRAEGRSSVLWVSTLREHRPFEPALHTATDLQQFIDDHKAGRHASVPVLAKLPSLAVTALAIDTHDLDDYREFLETVHAFLIFVRGGLINPYFADPQEFWESFLGD